MEKTTTPFSNFAMSENEINEVMRDSIKRGAAMVVRMITAARMRKTNNPFIDDCYKDSTSIYVSGVSYQNMVNKALEREGKEATFETEASSGMEHDDDFNVIMVSEDGSKHYIDLKQEVGTKRVTKYIHADGRPYSEYELGILEQFLIKPSQSKKQSEAGLSNDVQIICIRPDVRNIISIRQGSEIELVDVAEAKA